MDTTLTTARLFDTWLGQVWIAAKELVAACRAAWNQAARRQRLSAMQQLADRYESSHPGYASDLRAAAAQMECEIAVGRR
jgi:hypothetical protein